MSEQINSIHSDKPQIPSLQDAQKAIPDSCRKRLLSKGLFIFTFDFMIYLATLAGIVLAPAFWQQALFCFANGCIISLFFLTGHDSAHNSLTPYAWLNRLLSYIAFAPALTPYTGWHYTHNISHHGYANLESKDHAWKPRSKEQYDRLNPIQKWCERSYKSLLGMISYWNIEVWWKCLMFPEKLFRMTSKDKRIQILERVSVMIYPFIILSGLIALNTYRVDHLGLKSISLSWLIFGGVVIPYIIWSFFVGFIIFFHHTHPDTVWYSSKEEWQRMNALMTSTTHILLPRWLDRYSHRIMQHTAHHVDTTIPLYHLRDAQKALEKKFAPQVIHVPFSWKLFHEICTKCQLYDFTKKQWLDFKGNPTTPIAALS